MPSGLRCLGTESFGITDNFFAVGGHSLAAASLVSRAEKATGISISLAKLFQNPTILGLVDQLGKEKGEPQQDDLCCLIPLQPLGSRPPLVIVPGFGGGLFFEEGARFLAPHQPVYGLRVIGDPVSMGCQSFETIISTFADLIVDFWRQGDVNLMGYSAGGWYAHALAAELLKTRPEDRDSSDYRHGSECQDKSFIGSNAPFGQVEPGSSEDAHAKSSSRANLGETEDIYMGQNAYPEAGY